MHYLFERNGGKPVTAPTNNLLFTGNGVVLDEVHNWEKRCAKGNIHVKMVPLHPEHYLLTSAWPVISAKQDQKLLAWYNKTKLTAEELAASGSPLPAAGNLGSPFDLTKELFSHLSSATKSAKDRSNEDLIQNSIHSWQLVGSRVDTQDGTNASMVIPGSMNPTFALILKETNKRIRGTKLASALHFHIEQQRKERTLAAMASKWTKEQFDVPFANAIAEFTVLNYSIVSESSSFGYKITIFCFLVVLVTNFHFQKRVTGEQFANPWRFGSKQSPEDDGVVWPTQNWFTRQTATAKCVPHNVLVTIQDAIAGFFAFASNAENILSLSDDKAVPPMQLEEARIHADEVLKEIKVAVSKSSNPFGEPSLVWQFFHFGDRKPAAESKGANAGRNVVVIEPPLKKQKSANDDLVNRLKQTGFLRCDQRRVPTLNVSFPMPKGDTARLCIGHCFVGRFCKHEAAGTVCGFAHPNDIASIPAVPKNKLIEAVKHIPVIDFVSGCGPSTPTGEGTP
ncbi:hypothetical protein IV203_003850 [Nitzschia inconspicua]|uniref:Uncharacterized protein n=1 Tax=Nitzschia inconspicua TaxID=303405 RepID=A0A9K3PRC3_9STRA|nr:hypothetical protein IV203_003850 [Nitzschia inconspicua]